MEGCKTLSAFFLLAAFFYWPPFLLAAFSVSLCAAFLLGAEAPKPSPAAAHAQPAARRRKTSNGPQV
ncbi:MAG: hypothetical protein ABL893_09085, partial [Hyphomicrobium sp.]